MSVKTSMTALADQVRRVSGKTGKMTVDEMTSALSDVLDDGSQEDENSKSVYTGTISTEASTSIKTSLTIDTGVTLSDDDIFLLVPNSENQNIYTSAAVLVARYAPTTSYSICAEIKNSYLYHEKYESADRVVYSGTTVTVSGVKPFLCVEYMWILIK